MAGLLIATFVALGAGVGIGSLLNGGKNKSKQINKIFQENITDATLEFMSDINFGKKTTINVSNSVTQIFTKATINGCLIQNQQTINLTVNDYTQWTNSTKATFNRDIQNKITEALKNAVEQTNEKLNFNQENVSIIENNTYITNRTDLSQKITNLLDIQIDRFINAQNTIFQDFSGAKIDCTGSDASTVTGILNEQNIDIKAIITDVLNTQQVIESTSRLINDTAISIDNSTIQLNKGVDPLSFLAALGLLPLLMILLPMLMSMGMLRQGFKTLGFFKRNKEQKIKFQIESAKVTPTK